MYKYEVQNSKKSIKITKFEVEKKLSMESTEIKEISTRMDVKKSKNLG